MEEWLLGLIAFGILVGLPLLVIVFFHGGARTTLAPDPLDPPDADALIAPREEPPRE